MARAKRIAGALASLSLLAKAHGPGEGLRLSLREAIHSALQNNLQVSIARQERETDRFEAQSSEGIFDWNLTASAKANRTRTFSSQPQPFGPEFNQEQDSHGRTLNGGLKKLFDWGGTFAISYAPAYAYSRTTTTGGMDLNGGPVLPYESTTPAPYNGNFSANYTQKLLRGCGRAATTADLVVARKQAEASDYRFHLAVIQLVADTETQYWDVVFAERNLANKRTALALAQKLLKENTLKVEVGTMAPIDITFAESQVAKAEQDIIKGEAQAQNARDTLLRGLFPGMVRSAVLELTDGPNLSYLRLAEDAAVRMALLRRIELKTARTGQSIAQVKEKSAADRVRPQLDAFAQYDGGSDTHTSLGPVNGDLAGFRNPGYTVGLSFTVPIQNREAKGRRAAARAGLRASELKLRDQELSITLEVRKAIRTVEASEKGVEAAAKTRHFQEKNLEGERKKFENGLSTNFTILQVMTNLDNARSEELQAQIDYAKAVTAMEVAMGNLIEARNLSFQAAPS
jgi:outer membrane protein TolC